EIGDFPRGGVTIAGSLRGQSRGLGRGEILQPLGHLAGRAGAEIAVDIGVGADGFREFQKLMGTEGVGIGYAAPVGIEGRRPGCTWTDPIAPVILVRETTARPADVRNVKLTEGGDHIITKTMGIGDWRVLSDPDTLVDSMTQVLGKLTVNVAVNFRSRLIGVHDGGGATRGLGEGGGTRYGCCRKKEQGGSAAARSETHSSIPPEAYNSDNKTLLAPGQGRGGFLSECFKNRPRLAFGAPVSATPLPSRIMQVTQPSDLKLMNGQSPAPEPRSKPLRLHGTIARELGISIVSGRLKPGDLLGDEISSSEQFEVSRTAYREAVRILAAKGLVDARPKVGTRVNPRTRWHLLDPDVLDWTFDTEPDVQLLNRLFELRNVVESAAAGLAAQRRSAVHL